MYLRIHDYVKSIQSENLQQIINQDDSVRIDSERAALEEIKSYLVQKFNVAEEFTDLQVYDPTRSYVPGLTLELNGSAFIITQNYHVDDVVVYNNNVYMSNGSCVGVLPTTVSTANTWILLGSQYKLYYTVLPANYYIFDNIYFDGDKVMWNNKLYTCLQYNRGFYPDDKVNGPSYWSGYTYTVSANTNLFDTNYFAAGDFRSQGMVRYMVDITLYIIHSRIAPKNIPDLRVKQYDDAIKWLKSCAKGDITPNLLVKTPRSGGRWRLNSEESTQNNY